MVPSSDHRCLLLYYNLYSIDYSLIRCYFSNYQICRNWVSIATFLMIIAKKLFVSVQFLQHLFLTAPKTSLLQTCDHRSLGPFKNRKYFLKINQEQLDIWWIPSFPDYFPCEKICSERSYRSLLTITLLFSRMSIGIAGGGISGLSFALKASRISSKSIRIYEKDSSLGGWIQTVRTDSGKGSFLKIFNG